MKQLSINLFQFNLSDFLVRLVRRYPRSFYDLKKHNIVIENDRNEEIGYVRLPLNYVINDQLNIEGERAVILYVSIESGHAAVCVMDSDVNAYHTTFSAYMTRKKQGVSQIKYLNKKGKSRAGSRVRLAKTLEFFENINTSLTRLISEYKVDRIALNCTTSLIPYLYQSKVPCPFEKKDPRLYKIPLHIPQSNFTHLQKTIKKLRAPMFFYNQKYEGDMNDLIRE